MKPLLFAAVLIFHPTICNACDISEPPKDQKAISECVHKLQWDLGTLQAQVKQLQDKNTDRIGEIAELRLEIRALKGVICALALDLKMQQRWTRSPAETADDSACMK